MARMSLTRRGPRARGMTLIEIMVVVVIIGLVATLVGSQLFNTLDRGKKEIAKTQIKSLGEALELYRLSTRSYPSQAEGLQALVAPKGGEAPFIDRLPQDPWNNPYVYVHPGSHNPQGFDLFSYGKDGVASDDDVGNWEEGGK